MTLLDQAYKSYCFNSETATKREEEDMEIALEQIRGVSYKTKGQGWGTPRRREIIEDGNWLSKKQ